MRTLIITEGGRNIGFGHITRCISLYQAFKKNGAGPVFIVNGDKTAGEILAGYDCRVFNWLKDKQRLFDAVKGADIAVVDSYLADAGIYKKIADLAKAAVYLDDNMRIDYPKGIVVNGSVSAELMKYPKSSGVEYLLGSRYALMRKEFWNAPAKPVTAGIKNIMVTFGGTDGKNMTPKILRFLNAHYPAATKNVIIGAGFKNIKEIERIKDKKINLIYGPDAKKMRAAMRKSDIAISAAGQTLFELARMGAPAIVVCVADNQERNLNGWRESGFIEYAGWHDDKMLLKKLCVAISRIYDYKSRLAKSNTGRSLVDGKGAERIARYLIKRRQNENG